MVKGDKGVKHFSAVFSYVFFLSFRRDSTVLEKVWTGHVAVPATLGIIMVVEQDHRVHWALFCSLYFLWLREMFLDSGAQLWAFFPQRIFQKFLSIPVFLCVLIYRKVTSRFVVSCRHSQPASHNLWCFALFGYQQVVSIAWISSSMSYLVIWDKWLITFNLLPFLASSWAYADSCSN